MAMGTSPFGRENRFEKHEYLPVYIMGMNYYKEYYPCRYLPGMMGSNGA
jgi:hypothetical protein